VRCSREKKTGGAYLRPHFQNILEGHTRLGQLTLQHHNNVFVVFFEQLALCRSGRVLSFLLFRMRLKLGDVLVNASDVLFDDESEFLDGI
jgi:hypothetical protein